MDLLGPVWTGEKNWMSSLTRQFLCCVSFFTHTNSPENLKPSARHDTTTPLAVERMSLFLVYGFEDVPNGHRVKNSDVQKWCSDSAKGKEQWKRNRKKLKTTVKTINVSTLVLSAWIWPSMHTCSWPHLSICNEFKAQLKLVCSVNSLASQKPRSLLGTELSFVVVVVAVVSAVVVVAVVLLLMLLLLLLLLLLLFLYLLLLQKSGINKEIGSEPFLSLRSFRTLLTGARP